MLIVSPSTDVPKSVILKVVDGTVTDQTGCPISDFKGTSNIGGNGAFLGGKPTVCAGVDGNGASHGDCFQLNQDGSWQMLATVEARSYYAYIATSSDVIWVTGGLQRVGFTNKATMKTEYVASDGSVSNGPNLPMKVNSHCLAATETQVFLTGGHDKTTHYDDFLVYSIDSEGHVSLDGSLPSMNNPRNGHGCTVFSTNNDYLFVGGGFDANIDPIVNVEYILTDAIGMTLGWQGKDKEQNEKDFFSKTSQPFWDNIFASNDEYNVFFRT